MHVEHFVCLQPERIDPPDPNRPDYDIRADVWSLGISLVSTLYMYDRNSFEKCSRSLILSGLKLPELVAVGMVMSQ